MEKSSPNEPTLRIFAFAAVMYSCIRLQPCLVMVLLLPEDIQGVGHSKRLRVGYAIFGVMFGIYYFDMMGGIYDEKTIE